MSASVCIFVSVCVCVYRGVYLYCCVSFCSCLCICQLWTRLYMASICPPYKTGTRQLPAPPLTPTKFLPGTAVCSFLPCAHFWFCPCTRVGQNNGSTSQCSGKMQPSDPNLQKGLQCRINVVASWWKTSLQIRSWGVPVTLLAAAWEKSCTNPPAPSHGPTNHLEIASAVPSVVYLFFCEKLMEWLLISVQISKASQCLQETKANFNRTLSGLNWANASASMTDW